MLKIANQDIEERIPQEVAVPQRQIEVELEKVVNIGNIECIYLFSAEGLPLAGVQGSGDFVQDDAVEVAYSVSDALEFMRNTSGFKGCLEALLVGRTRRSVAIRTFTAFGQEVTLVLVIPRGRRYRALTNRIIRAIKEISQSIVG